MAKSIGTCIYNYRKFVQVSFYRVRLIHSNSYLLAIASPISALFCEERLEKSSRINKIQFKTIQGQVCSSWPLDINAMQRD